MTNLITGGSCSDKSAFAQQRAEQINGPRLFIVKLRCSPCKHVNRYRAFAVLSGFSVH